MQPPPLPKPASSVPPHMRPATGPAAMSTTVKYVPVAGPSRQQTTPVNSSVRNANTGLSTPIKTPAHAQPALANHPEAKAQPANRNPLQALQPVSIPSLDQTKHVAFATPQAPPPRPPQAPAYNAHRAAAEDESFGLNSEDDAFFASVDLGEGETMIEDPEEGLGGPIDFDEGLGIDLEAESEREPPPPPQVLLPQQPRQQLQQHQEDQGQLLAQQRPPQGAQRQQLNPQIVQRTPQQQQPRRHLTSVPQAQAHNSSSTEVSSAAALNATMAKQDYNSQRTMGGFHFPAGVVRTTTFVCLAA